MINPYPRPDTTTTSTKIRRWIARRVQLLVTAFLIAFVAFVLVVSVEKAFTNFIYEVVNPFTILH